MKRLATFLGLGAAVALGALAYAQVLVPTVPTVNPTLDLIQVIPNGQPTAQSRYASIGEVTSTSIYTRTSVASGAAFSVAGYNNYFTTYQADLLLDPANTMPWVYFTFSTAPSDGQKQCFFSTATGTAVVFGATTGQTVSNKITALTANTRYCYTWSLANANWYRSQ